MPSFSTIEALPSSVQSINEALSPFLFQIPSPLLLIKGIKLSSLMEYNASIGGFRGHLTSHRLSLPVKMAVKSKQWGVRTVEVRAFQFAASLSCSSSMYDLLRLPYNASARDIKRAYRQMALRYHPDVCPPAEKEEATKLFVEVREAYETLSDPALREDYDWRLQNGLELSHCGGRIRKNSNSLWEAQLVELRSKRSSDCYRPSWGSEMRRRNQQNC